MDPIIFPPHMGKYWGRQDFLFLELLPVYERKTLNSKQL